jgi:hypothetical protein
LSILILALTILLLVMGIRWFLGRAPQLGKRFLLQLLLVTLALLGIWLTLSGRLPWLLGLFSALLPFTHKLLPLLLPLLRWLPKLYRYSQQRRTGPGSSTAGQQSEIKTRWLAMSLDHDSGNIAGTIVAGPFAGRQLAELSDQELYTLYRQAIRKDPEGVKLLDAYIARHRPDIRPDSHSNNQSSEDEPRQASSSSDSNISTADAYQILGLEPGASEQEIIKAHKRMMQKNHPDRGGSNYLAAKINQAKQRLLS